VTLSPRLRGLAVFLAAVLALALLAGRDLLRPGRNNHFSHMAQGWLDGRLALAGDPPGYADRSHDDWGRVWTLDLADGTTVRGRPCVTAECTAARRGGVERWWTTRGELVDLRRRDIVKRASTWYVTFPPGPALVMLPGVALFGLGFPDVLFTALCGALIPLLLLRLLERVRPGHTREHLWAAAAWTLASPACFVAAHGSVWFTAQILGAMFLVLHIGAAWDARRPVRAGLWLGLAVACRVSLAFAVPFFLLEWWRGGRRLSTLLRFLAPLTAIGLVLALLNSLRFDDPLEFGHAYLDIRWQTRIQTFGMFSPHYLARNLEAMLWLVPQVSAAAPYLRWSIHGMGLLIGSPWLLLLARARQRFPQRAGLALAALAVAIPSLLYQNTGQLQFAYRFALDFLPCLLVLLVLGGGARGRLFPALVLASAAVQLHGAWWFTRAPGWLFVHDPWWPFPPE
jgi:hypothetical protein